MAESGAQPFVAPGQASLAEFTFKAVVVGVVCGFLFLSGKDRGQSKQQAVGRQ